MNKNNFEALGDIMTGKIFNLKRKAYGGRQGQYLSRFASVLHDPDYGFYVEDYFNDLLRMERKRTERSRKPFLLMLMDVTGCQQIGSQDEVLRRVASVILESTREIDVKGWYKYDTIVGILFTELNGSAHAPGSLKEDLLRKMTQRLVAVLEPAWMRRIIITCHVFPEEEKIIEGNIVDETAPADLNLYPDLVTNRDPSRKFSMAVKRIFDIVGSLTLITALSPVLAAVALAVKVSSKGPVLFKQQRVGRFGKSFTFLKFRSMHVQNNPELHKKYVEQFIAGNKDNVPSAGEMGAGCFKIKNDPRVTPVGRFIRKTSLDELPQLFNVLKGDMSLVGPRPPLPYETTHYDIWHKGRILEVMPGITGLWQVEGRSSTTFDEMVRLDLKYTREWSLWLDLRILIQTPLVVFTCRGAY